MSDIQKAIIGITILVVLAAIGGGVPFATAYFFGVAWGIIGSVVFGYAALRLVTWSAEGSNIMGVGPVVIVGAILIVVGLVAGSACHLLFR